MKSILDWFTIKEFEKCVPLNMLHKEQDFGAAKRLEEQKSDLTNVHVLFRTSFEKKGDFGKTELCISGDDYYKLYVNGRFVTQGPAPSYPENYYYNVADITDYLSDGNNSVAVHLYYQGLVNRVWNSGDNRLALGTRLASGGNEIPLEWYYSVSNAFSGATTGYDTQFLEDFDSRKWDENWAVSADYRQNYEKAVPALWADYVLTEQPTKQLRVYEVEPEKTVITDEGAEYREVCGMTAGCNAKDRTARRMFVDFGKEITGTLRISAKGSAGKTVTIRCGEELAVVRPEASDTFEGTDVAGINVPSVRYAMRCNCNYEETWTLKDGISTFDGYDYKGFRYVELLFDGETEITDIKAVMRHYPFDDDYCAYTGNDEKLKAIFDLCKYTVKLGTQENYVDCPTREKGQYLGDAIITARAHVHLTGNTDMLRKCIDQFARTASVCPGLLAVAPGALMQEIADFSLLWSELLLTDFYFTGDKEFLGTYYPVAEGIIRHFEQYENENGLLDCVADKWNLVDWPENLRDGYDFALTRPVVAKGCHNVINALYLGARINLAKIQGIIDKNGVKGENNAPGNDMPDAARKNLALEDRIKAFNTAFIDVNTGLYKDSPASSHSSLHSNVYPLYFGFAPKQNIDVIADFVETKGLECGLFISYFALKGLINSNRKAAAYRLLTNDGENGWLNMLREGATTAFEAWGKDRKWNTSLCHPWACGPVSVILEDM